MENNLFELPKEIKPFNCDDLVRLGCLGDGGYVVPKFIIEKTDFLLSFGLGENWTFEEDFCSIKNVPVGGYDYSFSWYYVFNYFIVLVMRVLLRIFTFNRIKEIPDLISFFSKKVLLRPFVLRKITNFYNGNKIFYPYAVSNKTGILRMEKYDIFKFKTKAFDEIISETKSKNIFLKMDIEGGEYFIIDDILKSSDVIVGMAIEFHDLSFHTGILSNIYKLLSDFGIVHVAVNDVVGTKEGDMPSCVEITFVNRKYLKSTDYSKSQYPIKGLDYSNGLSCNNLKVKFIGNTYD